MDTQGIQGVQPPESDLDITLCRPCAIRGVHTPAINYLETPSVPFWPLCERHTNVVRRSLYGDPKPINAIEPEPGTRFRNLSKENK